MRRMLVGDVGDRRHLVVSCRGDQRVDRSELAGHPAYRRGDGGRVGDVDDIGCVVVAVESRNVTAVLLEGCGDGRADAGGRSGDDGDAGHCGGGGAANRSPMGAAMLRRTVR